MNNLMIENIAVFSENTDVPHLPSQSMVTVFTKVCQMHDITGKNPLSLVNITAMLQDGLSDEIFELKICRYLPTKSAKTSLQKIDQLKRLLQKLHFAGYWFNLLLLDINHRKSDTIVLCHEFSQF